MNRGISALVACSAIGLAAGCGSSSSSSSTSAPAAAPAASTPQTSTPAASGSATPQSGVVAIAYHNVAIAPSAVKVKLGSTIKWTNFDAITHNVISKGGPQKFASKDIGAQGTFEIKASKVGIISYLCTFHPASMNGTIEVVQ